MNSKSEEMCAILSIQVDSSLPQMHSYFQLGCTLRPLLSVNESADLLEQREESIQRRGQSRWAELPFLPQGGVLPLFSLHLAAQMVRKLIGGRKH